MSVVTVRYFAAARAATGISEEPVSVADGASVADLLAQLGMSHGSGLVDVLRRCSFLLDEVAVRDLQAVPRTGSTLDVLPPFAGG